MADELNDQDSIEAEVADSLGVYSDAGHSIGEYRKLIASVVTTIVAILATQGIEVDPAVSGAIVTILGGALVWWLRNDPA